MGKVIAITGAGDGLGRALARRFARDGDTVILLGRTKAKIDAVVAELGEPHFAVQCDVCDPESVHAAFATVAQRHPHIDVLINNAAVFEPFFLADAKADQVKLQLETNVAGPIYCAHEALPLLRGSGHIINVTSESVPLKMPMIWMYGASKAALEYMSELWMRELAPEGVRVTIARCGQMMDETKAGSSWAPEVSQNFFMENVKVGLNPRDRGISHYNSATDAFRAIVDTAPDIQMNMVWVSSVPTPKAD